MRLQETPDDIPDGGTPHTVSLLMHDKLVDAGKPGDRVEVNPQHNNIFISRVPHYVCSSDSFTFSECYCCLISFPLCIRSLGFTGL